MAASTSYPIERFGGLNLFVDATAVGAGAATACQNVALDIPGQVRTRDGYHSIATTSTAPTTMHVHTNVSRQTQFLTSSSTKLEAFDIGVSIATVAATGPHTFVNAGTPSNPASYACASGDASLRKWAAGAWSTVAAAPGNARCIAWDPDSSRLILAGHGGGDRVQWSAAGDAATWPATNFVDLTPGDGEFIVGACTWQGNIFVFKQTKYFVFTGESTDSAGNPVFDYYTHSGTGALQGPGTVLSSPNGVYFLTNDGLYKTGIGTAAQRISQPLASVFRASGGTFSTACFLAWHYGRLVVTLNDSVTTTTYVWYADTDSWSKWTVQSGKNGGMFVGGDDLGFTNPTLYWVNGTDSAIYGMDRTQTTDAGSAIAWDYTSGYYDLGDGLRKIVKWTDVTGSGTVTLQLLAEGAPATRVADTGSSVVLGTAPAIDTTRRRRATSGRLFAHKLSGSGVATVSGLTHYVDNARQS